MVKVFVIITGNNDRVNSFISRIFFDEYSTVSIAELPIQQPKFTELFKLVAMNAFSKDGAKVVASKVLGLQEKRCNNAAG